MSFPSQHQRKVCGQRIAAGPRTTQGFSLIELMVGIVIGMIAIIVISQVFALNEGFRRTTTGGDDATNNGAIALIGLQRDIQQGGYGMSAVALSGCTLALPAPAAWTLPVLVPIAINLPDIPAGDANTDTVMVTYANGNGSPEGDRVIAQPAVATYSVMTPAAFAQGDRVIALPAPAPSPCALRLEESTLGPSPNISVTTGVAGMANGVLFNLGRNPRVLVYAVRGANLTLCDFLVSDCADATNADDETVWVPIANNVVSLRAEYGRDTTAAPMDGTVDVFDQTQPTTACEWARVSAARVALVTRSGQLEREVVTANAPARADSAAAPIDLSGLDDWGRYRYRTFEATVPMRNVTWQGARQGC